MSEITTQLNQQLKNNKENKIIKDESKNRWFTGSEISADVQKLKNEMISLKIGHGDVVLVCLPNTAVYPVIIQAIWELGAIAHPIAATTPKKELLQVLSEHPYAASIVSDNLVETTMQDRLTITRTLKLKTDPNLNLIRDQNIGGHVDKKPTEEDLALILNTSGTTGKPKRVGLSHRILNNGAKHDIESHKMTSDDTTLIVMPMFHINAQVVSVLSTRLSGGRIVIANKFSASKFWHQVRENNVTWVSVVPTIINILLINQTANLAYDQDIRLRFVRCSSFALPLDKLKDFENRFNTRILEGYGMTETASQCTLNPFDAPKVGSAGKPFKTEVEILVNDEFTKEPHQVGEIAVRGDHVINSYLDPHPDSFKDGWFLTGDLGYFDEDGYLFIKGRIKDIINRGGEKVAPAQVENVLSQLQFVKEVSVIGTPDEMYGEAVTAVVISQSGADKDMQEQMIKDYATETLANYEQPTKVVFVDDYPRNATGKVLRLKLKKQILDNSIGEVV